MEARHPRETRMPPKVKEGAGQGAWVDDGSGHVVRDRGVFLDAAWITAARGLRIIGRFWRFCCLQRIG